MISILMQTTMLGALYNNKTKLIKVRHFRYKNSHTKVAEVNTNSMWTPIFPQQIKFTSHHPKTNLINLQKE